jgi:two-component system sensor histidine kinase YesM
MFSDELNNVDDYLKIQKYRFEVRFTVVYKVDRGDIGLMSMKVPKLTLQPLVENAIRHGLEGMVSGGIITIGAYATESRFYVSVEDNGKGMLPVRVKEMNRRLSAGEDAAVGKSGEGIALYNVNKRIQFLFGREYGLSIASTEGYGTAVEIVIPVPGRQGDV